MKSFVAGLLLVVLMSAAPQKGRKSAEVEVLETRARRTNSEIFIDVRVRSEKALHGLVVYFDLLSPENGVVTSQKAVLEENRVEAGEERSTSSAASDHVRAVRYRIRVFDAQERELRVGNAGPFPIE